MCITHLLGHFPLAFKSPKQGLGGGVGAGVKTAKNKNIILSVLIRCSSMRHF